jgi:hypothetical protein
LRVNMLLYKFVFFNGVSGRHHSGERPYLHQLRVRVRSRRVCAPMEASPPTPHEYHVLAFRGVLSARASASYRHRDKLQKRSLSNGDKTAHTCVVQGSNIASVHHVCRQIVVLQNIRVMRADDDDIVVASPQRPARV